jgi:hypothetical protein
MATQRLLKLGSGLLALCASTQIHAQTFLNPTPYLSKADSPFVGLGCFYLESFEDAVMNTPGLSADQGGVTSVIFGPSGHDSVDADDGAIDGSGSLGDSFFNPIGSNGVKFSFDPGALGTLPTRAGLVWTDGGGMATFEAFDAGGALLGSIGPVAIGDAGSSGETAEDRFFGVVFSGGISAIRISNTSGGLEVDHVQYGLSAALPANETVRLGSPPNPAALLKGVSGQPLTGGVWDPKISHASFMPAATVDLLGITPNPINFFLPPWGTLLCDPTVVLATLLSPAGVPFAVPVPSDCGLAGLTLCTQGASIDPAGKILLTNALDIKIGTL